MGKFSPIVSAAGVGWPFARRTVEQQNHAPHFVKLDQIRALGSHLNCAEEIRSARCERAASTGNVEAIETGEAQLSVKKLVGLILKPAVGARDDKRVRTVNCPLRAGWQLSASGRKSAANANASSPRYCAPPASRRTSLSRKSSPS